MARKNPQLYGESWARRKTFYRKHSIYVLVSLHTIQVASTAHRLLSLLAEGLGQGFHPYFRSILGAMLLKLKDKKCVGILGTCLDKIYGNPHSLDQVRARACCLSQLCLCIQELGHETHFQAGAPLACNNVASA